MKLFFQDCKNEIYLSKRNDLKFNAHFHNNIEIIYILSGTTRAFAGDVDCILNPGDFFISFPSFIHYYDNCSEDLEFLIANMPYEIFPEYLHEFNNQQPITPKIENVNPDAAILFDKTRDIHGRYKPQIIRAYLSAMIGMIFEKTEFISTKNAPNNTMQEIVTYCKKNYTHNISLDNLSADLHISKSRITHILSEKLHIQFRTLVNQFRLRDAEYLLNNSKLNITEIAMQSGFENIRTFNRVFTEHYGCSPSSYRKSKVYSNNN